MALFFSFARPLTFFINLLCIQRGTERNTQLISLKSISALVHILNQLEIQQSWNTLTHQFECSKSFPTITVSTNSNGSMQISLDYGASLFEIDLHIGHLMLPRAVSRKLRCTTYAFLVSLTTFWLLSPLVTLSIAHTHTNPSEVWKLFPLANRGTISFPDKLALREYLQQWARKMSNFNINIRDVICVLLFRCRCCDSSNSCWHNSCRLFTSWQQNIRHRAGRQLASACYPLCWHTTEHNNVGPCRQNGIFDDSETCLKDYT